jgi:hypothetical protein
MVGMSVDFDNLKLFGQFLCRALRQNRWQKSPSVLDSSSSRQVAIAAPVGPARNEHCSVMTSGSNFVR